MQTINHEAARFVSTITVDALHNAAYSVAVALCDALATDAGRDLDTLTDSDVIVAMRQPVTLAAAYTDLFAALGIDVPAAVRIALDS